MAIEEVNESKELLALRRAVAKALDRKRRLGQYAVVWRDGRPVRIEGEELARAVACGAEAAVPTSPVRESIPGGGNNGESRR